MAILFFIVIAVILLGLYFIVRFSVHITVSDFVTRVNERVDDFCICSIEQDHGDNWAHGATLWWKIKGVPHNFQEAKILA